MVFGYTPKAMENLGKILLRGLPKGLETALLQQLGEAAVTGKAEGPFDLVIQPGDGDFERAPATPVLAIDLGRQQRLGLLLRTARQMVEEPALHLEDFRIGPWLFRPQEKTLEQGSQAPVALTDKEVDILSYLAKFSAAGVTVGREELLRRVWGYNEGVDTHTLETHIYRLRQKIEPPRAEGEPQTQSLLVTLEDGYRLNL